MVASPQTAFPSLLSPGLQTPLSLSADTPNACSYQPVNTVFLCLLLIGRGSPGNASALMQPGHAPQGHIPLVWVIVAPGTAGTLSPLGCTYEVDPGGVRRYFRLPFKRCKWLPKCKARHLPAHRSSREQSLPRHMGDEWGVFSAGQVQQVLGGKLGLSLTWDVI